MATGTWNCGASNPNAKYRIHVDVDGLLLILLCLFPTFQKSVIFFLSRIGSLPLKMKTKDCNPNSNGTEIEMPTFRGKTHKF